MSLDGYEARGRKETVPEVSNEFPDGYFPFEESAARIPPKVRRPPYAQADVECPGNSFASTHFITCSFLKFSCFS